MWQSWSSAISMCQHQKTVSSFSPRLLSNGNFNQANSHTNKEANVSNVISYSTFVEKEIQINGKNAKCLFDTGSELNLANYETYHRLGIPEYSSDEIQFSGIANELVRLLE